MAAVAECTLAVARDASSKFLIRHPSRLHGRSTRTGEAGDWSLDAGCSHRIGVEGYRVGGGAEDANHAHSPEPQALPQPCESRSCRNAFQKEAQHAAAYTQPACMARAARSPRCCQAATTAGAQSQVAPRASRLRHPRHTASPRGARAVEAVPGTPPGNKRCASIRLPPNAGGK